MGYLDKNSAYIIGLWHGTIPEIVPVRPEATYMIWLDCRKLGMSGKRAWEFLVNKAKGRTDEGSSSDPEAKDL